jgi:hypothetical protein
LPTAPQEDAPGAAGDFFVTAALEQMQGTFSRHESPFSGLLELHSRYTSAMWSLAALPAARQSA